MGGIENPRLTAEMMLRHILGLRRVDVYLRGNDPVSDPDATLFKRMVSRKLSREPIQYILGETEWFGITIKCDRRALIPRPETEIVVERALDLLQSIDRPNVADIGTGTGCIAIALAIARPDATLVGTDVSPDALELAQENIRRHSLENRIGLVQGDLFTPLPQEGLFDLIISNPPYVRSSELPSLMPEVRDYEPYGALLAGEDGLAAIRHLIREAPPYLKSEVASYSNLA